MRKKTRDWQERLLKNYRLPKTLKKEKSILDKKTLKKILKSDN